MVRGTYASCLEFQTHREIETGNRGRLSVYPILRLTPSPFRILCLRSGRVRNSIVTSFKSDEEHTPMRRMLIVSLLLSLLFGITSGSGLPKVTVVRFGKLIDGQGKVLQDAVVVIDGERISRAGSGDAAIP